MSVQFKPLNLIVEIAHDGHRARFRPITVEEQLRLAHWHHQREILASWHRAGRISMRPAIDEHAIKPRGAAFDSTGEAVVGVNEAGEPQWHSCDECVNLGAAALREKVCAVDDAIRTMTTDELVRLATQIVEKM